MDGTWMTRSMSAAAVGLSGWISSWREGKEMVNFCLTIAGQNFCVVTFLGILIDLGVYNAPDLQRLAEGKLAKYAAGATS